MIIQILRLAAIQSQLVKWQPGLDFLVCQKYFLKNNIEDTLDTVWEMI